MAERTDDWWAGSRLAKQAEEWAKEGRRVCIYVRGVPVPFEADLITVETFVAKLQDERTGLPSSVSVNSISAVTYLE